MPSILGKVEQIIKANQEESTILPPDGGEVIAIFPADEPDFVAEVDNEETRPTKAVTQPVTSDGSTQSVPPPAPVVVSTDDRPILTEEGFAIYDDDEKTLLVRVGGCLSGCFAIFGAIAVGLLLVLTILAVLYRLDASSRDNVTSTMSEAMDWTADRFNQFYGVELPVRIVPPQAEVQQSVATPMPTIPTPSQAVEPTVDPCRALAGMEGCPPS